MQHVWPGRAQIHHLRSPRVSLRRGTRTGINPARAPLYGMRFIERALALTLALALALALALVGEA